MPRMLIFFLIYSMSLIAAVDEEELELTQTSHMLHLKNDVKLPYTATTGVFPIFNKSEENIANLFFVSYTVDDEKNCPITFIFPGGPGGSCAAEVMCTIGPKRLITPDEGKKLLPPYEIIDNPETLLPWTDLVFVDPVTTGFSEFTEDAEDADLDRLWSVDGDIAALGRFVHNYVSYYQRWNSPKYLSGISYGTLRCCGLAEYLGIYDFSIHGLILLGSAIDYSVLVGQQNLPIPDCLLIPTFAATAWYHKRFWPEKNLAEVIDYARRFTYENYTPAMLQPSRLSPLELKSFYQELATLIGLSEDTVRRYSGRFNEMLFTTTSGQLRES